MNNIKNYQRIDISALTVNTINTETEQKILQQCAEIDKLNHEIYYEKCQKKKTILGLVVEVFGEKSPQFRYIKKQTLPSPTKYKEWAENKIKALQTEKQQKLKQKETEEKKNKLQTEAVIYLQEHGKKLGLDFTIENAIDIANGLAYELIVQQYTKENIWHEFGGDDYCENCRGWDGKSHRCDCGNRRVAWEADSGFCFKNPVIYAQAH